MVACAVALGCGSKSSNNNNGMTGTGGVVGGGTGGTGTSTGAGSGTGGTGAAGFAAPMCPAATVTACGGTNCPTVAAPLAMACVQTCCTTDNKCGTKNALNAMSTCAAQAMNTSKCPDEMIMGVMVPGCCSTDGTTCGIMDVLAGSGMCVPRNSPLLALFAPGLAPKNCDGTTPTGTAGSGGGAGSTGSMAGHGGMGGTAGHGTAGAAGSH